MNPVSASAAAQPRRLSCCEELVCYNPAAETLPWDEPTPRDDDSKAIAFAQSRLFLALLPEQSFAFMRVTIDDTVILPDQATSYAHVSRGDEETPQNHGAATTLL